jgi:two-component system, OmpR family, sensor histidine kinase BaeS
VSGDRPPTRPGWDRGPGWAHHRKSHGPHSGHRFLFLRLLLVFGFLALLLVGGLSTLAFVVSRLLPGGGETPLAAWVAALCLVVLILIIGRWQGSQAYVRFAKPLADVINAADTVAQGSLGARVPEDSPGDFGRLARTFNRMVNELELADRRRRELMADVAHELRTPLHILQGNLEGLQDGIYQPTPEQIATMLDETHHLGRLVEDLRTLSLAEAGQLSLNKEPVAVEELLSDVSTSFGGLAEAGEVEFRVECDEETSRLTLVVDVGRLHQVFGNLIVNAIRHTPRAGSVTVLVERAAGSIRFVVRDTGPGISPEDLPHIFDRYWRADRDGSAGTSGLGLAIARQLVELHGGSISVESEPGRGTSFTVDLPLESAEHEGR